MVTGSAEVVRQLSKFLGVVGERVRRLQLLRGTGHQGKGVDHLVLRFSNGQTSVVRVAGVGGENLGNHHIFDVFVFPRLAETPDVEVGASRHEGHWHRTEYNVADVLGSRASVAVVNDVVRWCLVVDHTQWTVGLLDVERLLDYRLRGGPAEGTHNGRPGVRENISFASNLLQPPDLPPGAEQAHRNTLASDVVRLDQNTETLEVILVGQNRTPVVLTVLLEQLAVVHDIPERGIVVGVRKQLRVHLV
ncbi:photosystem I reaction center subunit XII, putative [Babesia ovata]|uniref:Photosystem I reaction center subunit XII, putative n=1 Tax=Babesia ovata TaxID=189622 RepID=A0A2H6KGQ4_9APIC|nr:photosystem I reaction center subunit XII, putative [Babesia ovata]GBE62149.1 photosystem I reaction center subunit XII, putative [Babesia ovata]